MSRREKAAVRKINRFRKRHGRRQLHSDHELSRRASRHARSQWRRSTYDHHGFEDRARGWSFVEEAVGMVQPADLLPTARMVHWWKKSPPHRDILLASHLTRIGVGEKDGYWCATLAQGRKRHV